MIERVQYPEKVHRLDAALIDNWQRGLPIATRPYQAMAVALETDEESIIARLDAMKKAGTIARVGAVVRPNTLGASTLAAVAVPDLEVDQAAAIMAAEPGINHVYLRENDWNLWFVATGPDRAAVDSALERVASRTGRKVLDLRLEEPYHIDLGFALDGSRGAVNRHRNETPVAFGSRPFESEPGDAALVQELMNGLALVARPFRELGRRVGRTEADVIARVRRLVDAGVLPRIGLIVRHRALGWRSNAMVVWDVPEHDVDRAGRALAQAPGVNLCYRRRRYEREWAFNLYCMIHAKSREHALRILSEASPAAELDDLPRQILFSLRCFKQTGAMVAATTSPAPQEAAR